MPPEPPMLIFGTGVSAKAMARAIHDGSARKLHAFAEVDCRLIPRELIESELFGQMKGALSSDTREKAGLLEQASRGTAFVDNISALDLAVQWHLLAAIQHGENYRVGAERPIPIDVRLIAASSEDLAALVEAKRFRHDLFVALGSPVNVE